MARRNKGEERAIARDRIRTLLALSTEALRAGHSERAHRYAEIMWALKTTYQLTNVGTEGRICRACHAFLSPGSTSRVRLTGGKRTVTCLRCGRMRRTPIVPKAARPE